MDVSLPQSPHLSNPRLEYSRMSPRLIPQLKTKQTHQSFTTGEWMYVRRKEGVTRVRNKGERQLEPDPNVTGLASLGTCTTQLTTSDHLAKLTIKMIKIADKDLTFLGVLVDHRHLHVMQDALCLNYTGIDVV